MTTPLPERPDLRQLKRQAKDLLRSAHAHEPEALARFRTLPAFAGRSNAELARVGLALHDAQSVLAREHGFPSWNALRQRVEGLTLGLDGAEAELVEALTDGRPDRARRLLGLHPGLSRSSFQVALLLGDVVEVRAHLARTTSLATRPGGRRGWEPLHYVCHTTLLPGRDRQAEGLVAISRHLLQAGADPNTRFPWLHHGVRRPVLWGATSVTRHLPLAELLLEAGADPDDGVTLPLAAGAGDLAALELLYRHDADVNQRWATDGSATLYAILAWAGNEDGIRWLLEHGADPDPVFADNGETPLHAVARSWNPALAEALVALGADPEHRRADGRTPFAVAELSGNRDVADLLLARGAVDDRSDVDRLVSACSRGDGDTVDALLGAHPRLRHEIEGEHYAALYQAAERGDTRALELLLGCGFDPDRPDESIGKTALHAAAGAGWPDSVRVLLRYGASVDARDREFHAQPLVWAAEASRNDDHVDRDYPAVARLLVEAGSSLAWEAGDEPSEGLLAVLAEWRALLR